MADDRSFDARLVEALFVRGLGAATARRLQPRLLEAGVDIDEPSQPCPRAAVLEALRVCASMLEPGFDASEGHRQLGARLVRGFTSGWKMKAVLAAARAAGWERTLERLVGRHDTPSNFLEVELARRGAGRWALELNLGAPQPEVLVGIVEEILAELGADGVEVRLVERGERERLEIRAGA
jgi:uncharacterized protein (TIGR02265 family)